MRWLRSFVVVSSVLAMACDEDPARSTKIIARPPAAAPAADARSRAAEPAPGSTPSGSTESVARPAGTAAAPLSGAAAAAPRAAEWRPNGCPPPPGSSAGPSSLAVAGPCAFEHRDTASCESLFDDFLVTMTRKGAQGATLMVFINVEGYHGPDSYTAAQMFVGLQDKTSIYRWSSEDVNITVGEGEKFTLLPPTRLAAEPVLVNCTGPMNNFQCEGRGDAEAFERTITTVSGRLQCEEPAKEK